MNQIKQAASIRAFCVMIGGAMRDPMFSSLELARRFADEHPDTHAEIWGPGSEPNDVCPRCWARRGPKGPWKDHPL